MNCVSGHELTGGDQLKVVDLDIYTMAREVLVDTLMLCPDSKVDRVFFRCLVNRSGRIRHKYCGSGI